MRAVFVHADERDMLVNTLAVAIGQSLESLEAIANWSESGKSLSNSIGSPKLRIGLGSEI
jgi:hypothetical protein